MQLFNDARARYLYEAVTCGSVRAAAEKMGIAPSAISRQVSLLEEELNAVLLERHRKGVVPTHAGQLLIDYYRQHMAHRHDMLAKIESLRGLQSGSISVVSGEGFAQEMIAGPIQQFRQQHPGVSISLDIFGTTEIMRRVREDEAEIGLVYYAPADAHIVSRGTALQPMHAIIGPNHPLRHAQQTSLQELTAWPMALLHGIYGIRQLIDHAERSEKIHLKAALTTNLISVAIGFVTSGQGVTLLPRCSVSTELAQGRVHAIPVHSAALGHAEVQLITRAGRHLSPAANRFLQYCMHGMQAFQRV
ncbi:LysR family transcriptional regulator [Corticimicrobacter populi]|uniref:LysR family transcriptional regulator n=1 Tax=Corticimicrobacter populi TaxID=2175229 RepID=A0A2V1K338_9BURK|nr:LysR family transcriptional regulator [Corticimicrobacter populi]PWF23977.1 LysR family transcriptional regulator [Corticimicrobacter populi]